MAALAKKQPALALDPAENFRGPGGPPRDELIKRIWFTLGALLVFRIGTHIPVPGIDPYTVGVLLMKLSPGVLSQGDALVGGALGRMSMFALGLTTYFAALVIVHASNLFSPIGGEHSPDHTQMRRVVAQKTRRLSVALAAVTSFGLAIALESAGVVAEPGWTFRITTISALTGGAVFLMWLGEQITRRGIGHGPSLIVATGIIAGLPNAGSSLSELHRVGAIALGSMLVLLAMIPVTVGAVVFFERARRRVLANSPRRRDGRRDEELLLRLNGAGMLPPFLASAVLAVCGVLATGFVHNETGISELLYEIGHALEPGQGLALLVQTVLIVGFAILFRHATHDPREEARKLADTGGFVPGIRPGDRTTAYLRRAQDRLTVIGACYVAIVCAVPTLLFSRLALPIFEITAGLVILTIVVMDLIERLQQAVLLARTSDR